MRVEYPLTEPAIGQPLRLQCCAHHSSLEVSSQPTLTWYKDGRILTASERHTRSHVEGGETCLTLKFERLEADDEGDYTCRASLRSSGMEELLVKEAEVYALNPVQPTTMVTTTESKIDTILTLDVSK